MRSPRVRERAREAVGPVIATLLLTAVTVVLGATLYVAVSGFGGEHARVAAAAFAARALDLPGGLGPPDDADPGEDALEIVLVTGSEDVPLADVTITLDGRRLSSATAPTGAGLADDPTTPTRCTARPGGDALWARGEPLFIWATTGAGADCHTPASLAGARSLKVVVRDRVVFEATVEVRDSLAS